MGLRAFAIQAHYSRGYLSMIERSKRPVNGEVVEAYRHTLPRRALLAAGMLAAADTAAGSITDILGSIAGGDAGLLTEIQTSYSTDYALAEKADAASVRQLRRWVEDEASPVLRVNAAGILAKLPGAPANATVIASLTHDVGVRRRYLTAVTARVCDIDWAAAQSAVENPAVLSDPRQAARWFATEAVRSHDVGARWCSANMLRELCSAL